MLTDCQTFFRYISTKVLQDAIIFKWIHGSFKILRNTIKRIIITIAFKNILEHASRAGLLGTQNVLLIHLHIKNYYQQKHLCPCCKITKLSSFASRGTLKLMNIRKILQSYFISINIIPSCYFTYIEKEIGLKCIRKGFNLYIKASIA